MTDGTQELASKVGTIIEDHYETVNGVTLNYLLYKDSSKNPTPSKPPIVLIHGLNANVHVFDDFAFSFVSNYEVISVNKRGHGMSEQTLSGYDVYTSAQDLFALLNKLYFSQGVYQKVTLMGHSMAGCVLTRFAAQYPQYVKRLVYLDAAHDYSDSETYTDINDTAKLENDFKKLSPAAKKLVTQSPALPASAYNSMNDYTAYYRKCYPIQYGSASETTVYNYFASFFRCNPDKTLLCIPPCSEDTLVCVTPPAILEAEYEGATNYSVEWDQVKAPTLILFPDYVKSDVVLIDYPYLVDSPDPGCFPPIPSSPNPGSLVPVNHQLRRPLGPDSLTSVRRFERMGLGIEGDSSLEGVPPSEDEDEAEPQLPAADPARKEARGYIVESYGMDYNTIVAEAKGFKKLAASGGNLNVGYRAIPNSNHYLFITNLTATVDAINDFFDTYS